MVVSFIGGGNRSTQRKPQTCRKALTNLLMLLYIHFDKNLRAKPYETGIYSQRDTLQVVFKNAF
jgi:hypothetical protein